MVGFVAAGSVMVVTQHVDEPVRAFHSVKVTTSDGDDDTSERSYVPLDIALDNDEYRQQILEQAARDLNTWRKKYGELQELHKFFLRLNVSSISMQRNRHTRCSGAVV